MFPLEKIPQIEAAPEKYWLLQDLHALPLPDYRQKSDVVKPFMIVDVETTGLDQSKDQVTELGVVMGSYDVRSLELLQICEPESWFNDPGIPIPPLVSELTGITDDMVRGQKLPFDIIHDVLLLKPLVIAHNAPFDRPFCERIDPLFAELPWACSCSGVDWRHGHGMASSGLIPLGMQHGFFYEAHRAGTDCLAVAQVFHLNSAAFSELIVTARKRSVLVQAFDFPYAFKDEAKVRGYRWNGSVWSREVFAEDIEAEKEFLDQVPGYRASRAVYHEITAHDRFRGAA